MLLVWLGFAFSFFVGDLVGERRVPSGGEWFRGVTMDFSFDVANFFGGLGCIDEGEVTTEAIVKLSKLACGRTKVVAEGSLH